MIIKKTLLLGILLVAFAGGLWARAIPQLTGPVVDEAGIFDAESKAAISKSLADYYQKTGSQYQVLTIQSLDGEVLENFSIHVADAWKIGNAKSDKGLILIFAAKDRQVRIEVGQGLEGNIPDAKAARIIDQIMIPAFRQGDYRGGIIEGLRACARAEGLDLALPASTSKVHPEGGKPIDLQLSLSIIGIILYCIYLFCRILFRAVTWWWPFGQRRRRKRHGKRYEGFWDGIFPSGTGSSASGGSSSSSGGSWSGGGGGFSGGGASGRW